jgi:AraC-like DNA-binding protein
MVQALLPSPPLRGYVRAFEYHSNYQPQDGDRLHVLPHPYQIARLQVGAPVRRWHRASRSFQQTNAFFGGPVTCNDIDVIIDGPDCGQFLIVFQPGGIRRLLGVPANHLVDQIVDAEALLGPCAREMSQRVQEARTATYMTWIVESYLLNLIRHADKRNYAEYFAQLQLESHGRIPVSELISASGVSRGRFEKSFLESIGILPKLYARMVRFDHALRLRSSDPAQSWMSISADAGYFDQNHFIKDFKAMTGRLPSEGYDPQWRLCDKAAAYRPVPSSMR